MLDRNDCQSISPEGMRRIEYMLAHPINPRYLVKWSVKLKGQLSDWDVMSIHRVITESAMLDIRDRNGSIEIPSFDQMVKLCMIFTEDFPLWDDFHSVHEFTQALAIASCNFGDQLSGDALNKLIRYAESHGMRKLRYRRDKPIWSFSLGRFSDEVICDLLSISMPSNVFELLDSGLSDEAVLAACRIPSEVLLTNVKNSKDTLIVPTVSRVIALMKRFGVPAWDSPSLLQFVAEILDVSERLSVPFGEFETDRPCISPIEHESPKHKCDDKCENQGKHVHCKHNDMYHAEPSQTT